MTRAKRPAVLEPPSLLALLVILLFGWVLWSGESPSRAKQPIAPVPSQVGLWSGTSLAVDERTRAILETDEVVLMEYRLSEQEPPVWFALEGGFGKRAAFHPPELCYVGSNFDILAREPVTVSANGRARRVMRLVIAQGGQEVEAWYWFTAAGRVTHNYYQQQLWLILDAILRKPSEGTLVRISTPLGDSPEASHRRLLAFLTSFESATAARQVARDGV